MIPCRASRKWNSFPLTFTAMSTMSSKRIAAVVALGFLPYVVAQNATIPTCMSGFDWAFNSLKQSPCQVAQALAEVCLQPGTIFTIPSLLPAQPYVGPRQGQATGCQCSSVYYSMLSACAVCQLGNVLKWTVYDMNCTPPFLTVYPSPIPSGFPVPHYAYLDVSAGDGFNSTEAQAAGGPESTSVPQSTGSLPSASISSAASTGKKSSHAGAIAGGVVGGIVGITILGLLVFWFLRRRRERSRSPMYDEPIISEHKTTPGGVTPFGTSPTPKLYDPNDPSTFPSNTSQFTSFAGSTPSFPSQFQGDQSTHLAPHFTGATQTTAFSRTGPQYSGVAEVM